MRRYSTYQHIAECMKHGLREQSRDRGTLEIQRALYLPDRKTIRALGRNAHPEVPAETALDYGFGRFDRRRMPLP